MKKAAILFFSSILFVKGLVSQQHPPIFHQLTTADGLNDGWINGICQDKYGYMWFGSLGALNRYNGKTVRTFTHARNDSTSPPASLCYAMACGPDGRLWLSFWNEIAEFDYTSLTFRKMEIASGFFVNTIIPADDGRLYLASGSGLRCYDPAKDQFESLSGETDTLSKRLIEKKPCLLCIPQWQ